jgi:hypothetical protein
MRWLLYDGSRFVMKDSGKVTIGQINPTDQEMNSPDPMICGDCP